MNQKKDYVLGIHDRPTPLKWIGLSLQHMFSMFGSTVIVPLLVGLSPSIALFASGIGTLLHVLITKGKIPAYMGSSFAFVTPMMALMKTTGIAGVSQGVVAVGLVYVIVATIISFIGSDWIDKILPPVVVGPIVMVIGLSLAGSAAQNAMMDHGKYSLVFFGIAMATLFLAIFFNVKLKGFLGLIPILLAIVCGYLISVACGLVDIHAIVAAPWFKMPPFHLIGTERGFKFDWNAILIMAPIAFVTMTEHMGHLMVLGEMTHKDFFKDPGLNRTLAGDGAASLAAGILGGPAVTSYGENIGVMAITKVYSVWVIVGAAIFAMIFAFVNKLNVLIMQMPLPVIGGISFLLFGTIAANGAKVMIDNKLDMDKKRNLMIASVILVIGIGNAYIQIGSFQFTGVALATVIGIVLNLLLPKDEHDDPDLEDQTIDPVKK
ncbi:uracil-xanthine permease family protein [Fructilactobacillus fructivorans]|uniref:Uracil permease n=1 Tax=Fructilactobacillus fructivorans TaxID=1614 RepID=A0A0C1PMS1_9LACO|nr:solute carrier family 23 protein [Fructilactobacillus fructivorans]KID42057.1 Uracil permease [Fructilactobacillus fructivorans]MCT0151949.1 uracil permease [Fructilactobacillus fructivorans]MCT2867841.1 uracil permease [Fructilactobacillus fructivorans]MCT2868577.1 uracil permease [Fructilactobacillus fructivorans]MCT2873577.1 uracil permease [Fructilactobacillus fructivorans]